MRIATCLVSCALLMFAAITIAADGDLPKDIAAPPATLERYPPRIPDWLWTQPEYAGFVDEDFRTKLGEETKRLEELRAKDDAESAEFDDLEQHIARQLSQRFAVRDFAANGELFSRQDGRHSLAVVIDPKFSKASQQTILRAAALFLEVAADQKLIEAALKESIPLPTPQPDRYEVDEDGKPKKDKFGRFVFDGGYQFMREHRTIPRSAKFLLTQFEEAMPAAELEPGLLVVSQYSGSSVTPADPWWGGGYYNFFYSDQWRLNRDGVSKGYLYIRLNADQMRDGVAHHDDPAFWAGKLAHEILHNLGYWHPPYAGPTHRDENNRNGKAFMVAFEDVVRQAAEKKLSEKGNQ